MRIGSPATYKCKSKLNRGMHRWARVMELDRVNKAAWEADPARRAQCLNCGLIVRGEDAADIFKGAETPIGKLRLPAGWDKREQDDAE